MINKAINREISSKRIEIKNAENRLRDVQACFLINLEFEKCGESLPYDYNKLHEEAEILRLAIKEAPTKLSDEVAFYATNLFPKWDSNVAYKTGDRFVYRGHLYRCKMDNPVNPTWTPDVTHDYYEPVAKPSEDGTIDNPITSVEGMEYEVGKYYSEGDKVYLCTREGANEGDKFVLYYAPSELVGHYFEEVSD